MTCTFTGVTIPAWATLTDNGDGTFTLAGTPLAEQSDQVKIKATSASGEIAYQEFWINVAATPASPTFTSTPTLTGTEGVAYSYAITTTGGTGAITLTLPTKPAWATLTDNGDGTGTITGTPSAAGTDSFDLVVTDSLSLHTHQPFSVVVASAAAMLNATMTSNTLPAPHSIGATPVSADAFKIFDGNTGVIYQNPGGITAMLDYDIGGLSSASCNRIKFYTSSAADDVKGFSLQAKVNVGDLYTTLHSNTATNTTGWQTFDFVNATNYRYFRINVNTTWGGMSPIVREVELWHV
jgi:hypothetical protein